MTSALCSTRIVAGILLLAATACRNDTNSDAVDPNSQTLDAQANGFLSGGTGQEPETCVFNVSQTPREYSIAEIFTVGVLGSPRFECSRDRHCTDPTQGYCTLTDTTSDVWGTRCIYDPCQTDQDCAADSVCDCARGWPECRPATCKASADCETGALCLRTLATKYTCVGSNFPFGLPVIEYHCQTREDECAASADCGTSRYDECIFLEGRHVCVVAETPRCGVP